MAHTSRGVWYIVLKYEFPKDPGSITMTFSPVIDPLHSWPLWTNNLQKANILTMLSPKIPESCK
ncbi:hypothetical protein Hanom_Chr16g01478411 [Helianthus anomalus]